MPSGTCVSPRQFLAEEMGSCVKARLLAEKSSEPILVCSAFTAEVKKFALHV